MDFIIRIDSDWLSTTNKHALKDIVFVTWWVLCRFRNSKFFGDNKKINDIIVESIKDFFLSLVLEIRKLLLTREESHVAGVGVAGVGGISLPFIKKQ